MILDWLRSFRQRQPVTAAELRRHLDGLRRQQTETITRRDAVALDAIRDAVGATRWTALDDTARHLARRIDVLAAALPQAEAKEAEAREQAEATARAERMQDYQRQTVEAKQWADTVLARVTTGEELTQARALRDALRDEARWLSRWSHDVAVRRPFDPLDAIYAALAMRVQRIERSRWIHGESPITLIDDTRAAS